MSARRSEEAPGTLSRLAAGISGALIAGLLGYMTVHAWRVDERPAIVTTAVPGEAWSREGRSYQAFDVRNDGELAASDVVVEARDEAGRSIGRTTIEFLAGGETRRIYVVVPAADGRDRPAAGIRLQVTSFQEP